MFDEDDLIALSSIQHLLFCERQCVLIHVEQVWTDNRLTVEGRIMHEHVHEEGRESHGDIRVEHGVSVHSLRLGLIGKSDVVEFHHEKDGSWRPFPVEYKRGKPKPDDCDKVQLCAQAICLEEMLGVSISAGAIFYGRTRRRLDVTFDGTLRLETEEAVRRTHELISSGRTPPPNYSNKCESCSLMADCLPKSMHKGLSVHKYLSRMLSEP